MTRKTVLIDDLDGTSEASETLTYTVNGQEYEIDLSEENVTRFREALAPYIENSRPVERRESISGRSRRTSGGTRRRRSSAGNHRGDTARIRAWAEQQGMSVNPRGRIKKEIIDAYDEAHR